MAQIKKGFIAPNAIDGSKLRLLNNEAIRALAADGSDVELMKIDVDSVLQFLRTPQVSVDPVSDNDISRKGYVDAEVAAEAAAREAASGTLQDNIDAEQSARESADNALQAAIDALSLDSLTDVSMADAGSGDVLRYDGSSWTKEAPVDVAGGNDGETIEDTSFSAFQNLLSSFVGGFIQVNRAETTIYSSILTEFSLTGDENSGYQIAWTGNNELAPETLVAGDVIPFSQFTPEDESVLSDGIFEFVNYGPNGEINVTITSTYVYIPVFGSAGKLIKANSEGKLDTSFLQYNVNFGGNKLSGVSSPDAEDDAATKGYVDGQVSSEQSAREAADSNLQDQIDTEKGRVDAILLASDADKDSFAEIVQLINSVDTESDSAFGAYVLSNDAALAQEVSDRQAADSTLQDNIDAEESAREAADADLQSQINALEASAGGDLASETAAREAADEALSDRLDVIEGADTVEGSVAKAEKDAKDHADSIVASEQSAREAADSGLQDAIDQEVSDRQAAVSAEQSAREAADSALDARLDVLEGSDTTEGSVAKAEKDAKDYTDSAVAAEQSARESADTSLQNQINDILNNADPAALDSLSEIVAAFQEADSDLTDAITSVLGTHTSELNTEVAAREAADATLQSNIDAEEAAREAADSALDSRLDALEAVSEGRAKFTITQTDLDNQYLNLSHVAKADSTFMFYGPLYLHEGDDYTVSTVSGVSRLTFSGRIASGQPSQPIVGDVIYVRYKY